jgi:phosphohistidine phosphatase
LLSGARSGGTVTDAARRLTEGYPTGALAEFAIAGPWWQLDGGGGQLVRFVTPRDIGAGDLPDAAT